MSLARPSADTDAEPIPAQTRHRVQPNLVLTPSLVRPSTNTKPRPTLSSGQPSANAAALFSPCESSLFLSLKGSYVNF